jgi:arabinofuranan 3-O-arabinosyltransferase
MSLRSALTRQPPSQPDERPESEQHPDGRQPAAPGGGPQVRAPLPLVPLTIVSAALMALCFAQAPGRLLADTKLDLVIDPAGFLDRALHLWDPSASFGQVQNQAVGYLFPMGPFFTLGEGLGVPMWVVQRVWLGVVLIVALWGVAALARQLDIGRPVQWVVAGVAYALSPFFLGQLASTSAALLPAALAPWALLPLVYGSRGGSTRRAAALSGLAVAAMGGVNAAATAAVLPLPALWLISRRRSPRRRALAGWWVIALALATAWWALPLLFQLHWGFDFLPFTENAATTELSTSAFEGVRGTAHWLAYLNLSGPWLPGGWALVSTASVVLASASLAAAGFVGLARVGVPERGFLVASVLVGAVLVCAGYVGPAGGVLDGPIRSALDGPLDAFRNVHKFEPVLRLPLALGLAAALAAVPRRRMWEALATAGVTGVVLVGALPMLQGDLPQRGSFEELPDSWRKAARFLDRHSDRANALLVPAAPFGEYAWGRPLDDPLQPLADSPWAVRSLIPLGGPGSTSFLDAVEQRLQSGVSSPGLQRALARAGIGYVVARNDLDWRRAGAPRPVDVRAALLAAGLRRVKGFGAPLGEPQARGSLLPELGIGRYESRLPEIEIFAVNPRRSLVTTLPVARSIAVSGGPQSIPQLTDQGIVRDRDPTVTVVDRSRSATAKRWAVTDALRRTDTDFGLVHDKDSYTLAPGERAAGSPDPPRKLLSTEAIEGHAATSQLSGPISRVTASSYGSWLLQLPFVEPSNAFDGDSTTAWVTGALETSVGQWVRADFKQVIEPSGVRVRLLQDGSWRPRVTMLRVTTESGSITSAVRPDELAQRIDVPLGPTSWMRLTFVRVRGERTGAATAGLRDVQVLARPAGPGPLALEIQQANQWVRVPEERSQLAEARRAGASAPAFAFSRLSANPGDVLRRDQETQLRRIFVMPKEARMQVQATALPDRGPMLDSLLTDARGMSVSTTSSWNSLPGYRAGNVVDGSRRSAWIAQPPRPLPTGTPGASGLRAFGARARRSAVSPAPALTDPDPRIRLRWNGLRSLSRLRILPAGDFAASPRRIHLASPDGQRDLTVPRNGRVMRFRPLDTDRITVSFPRVALRYTTTGIALDPEVRLPVGLAELDFPALRGLQVGPVGPDTVVREPCGMGPPILLDGHRLPTAVSARAGDVVQLRSVPVRICSGDSIELAAGAHRLTGEPGSAFTLSSLTLRPPNWEISRSQRANRKVHIQRWSDEQRSIDVESGPSAYLAIRENFNDGWQATLGEQRLSAVRLDGWQQGFVLPAGSGGVVELSFGPEDSYGMVLRLGGGLALVLVALALVPSRRRDDDLKPSPKRSSLRGRPAEVLLAAGGTAAVALVSWPALFAVPVLVVLVRRVPRAVPWAAGGLVLAAALVAVAGLAPYPLEHRGAFGAPAQLLTATALMLLAVSLWNRPPELRSDAD